MYLSRLILNPRSRAVRRDLADCHTLHRTVMSGFPNLVAGSDARSEFGVLHRVDTSPRTGAITLLVQSAIAPNWDRLPGDYLVDTAGAPPNPDCKPVAAVFDALRAGMTLTFRLRANPTKRVSRHSTTERSNMHGKRVDLRTEAEQLAWLARKGEQCGFALVTVRASSGRDGERPAAIPDVRTLAGGKVLGRQPAGKTMTFGSVLFEGRLRITDAAAFRRALETGIGPGKAYGFGLLSIAPDRGPA